MFPVAGNIQSMVGQDMILAPPIQLAYAVCVAAHS